MILNEYADVTWDNTT